MMSKDMVYEDVPKVSRRVGDSVLAGSNNSTIILGRDRNGSTETGYGSADRPDGGKSAGAIHLVVGRKGEDPSIADDSATLYLSQKSDPDDAAETFFVGQQQSEKSALIGRADCMRFVPRDDFKLVVGQAHITILSDGSVTIDGDISLGKNAADRVLRGDRFLRFWNSISIPTPSGPSGPPPPIPDDCFAPRCKVG
jgi:hypothetical protein